jgi:hypothetical protein
MNSELEEGLKTWLEDEGVAVPLFTGFTGDEQPTDEQTVTVFTSNAERVTGPLYRATINFIVSTPPHDENTPQASLADHRATVNSIRALLEDHDETTLKTSLEASTSLFFHGGFLRSGGEATIEGGRWVTTLDFLAGIATEDIDA